MKKILIAVAGVVALGTTPMTFAQSVGDTELANTQELIKELQADKRAIMLDTLALTPDQLAEFTPIYDEYQAEMKALYTTAPTCEPAVRCRLRRHDGRRIQGDPEGVFQAPP